MSINNFEYLYKLHGFEVYKTDTDGRLTNTCREKHFYRIVSYVYFLLP